MPSRAVKTWRGYVGSGDPRVAAANLVAMVLAWNTPFWPLYLRGAAGPRIWPGGWLTVCVLPAFLCIPAVTRRYPSGGRVLLAVIAIGNTLFCTWLLGESAGTQLFLLPCITLSALLFRREERVQLLGLLALPIIAGLVLDGRYPASPFACVGAACSGIVWLNAISAAFVTAFLGMIGTGLASASTADPPTRRSPTRRP